MLQLVTAPATPVLSTTEAKAHLRVTSSSEDGYIDSLVKAATRLAENFTGERFISQTWRLSLDGLPGAGGAQEPWWEGVREGALSELVRARANWIDLQLAPVATITGMVTYDASDAPSTFDSGSYFLDSDSRPSRLVLKDGVSWPTSLRSRKAIEVTFVVGYGATAADVPEDVRQAIRIIVAGLYENRGDEQASLLSPAARLLLEPYVLKRLS